MEIRPIEALAATVVLLRESADGGDGPYAEVLLLERPDRGSFAGAWVFPGGRVDPADYADDPGDDHAALLRAAVRETLEETGLSLSEDELVALARWHPPTEAPRRFLTSFFIAEAPDGEIVLSPGEAVAHRWITPAEALAQHAEQRMLLFPPTWVTLWGLVEHGPIADVLVAARAAGGAEFATRFGLAATVMFWNGDVAYDDDARLDDDGGRHRLDMRQLPWVYSRDGIAGEAL